MTVNRAWKGDIQSQMTTLVGLRMHNYFKVNLGADYKKTHGIDLNMKLNRVEDTTGGAMVQKNTNLGTEKYSDLGMTESTAVPSKRPPSQGFRPALRPKTSSVKNLGYGHRRPGSNPPASFDMTDNKNFKRHNRQDLRAANIGLGRLLSQKKIGAYISEDTAKAMHYHTPGYF